MSLTPDEVKQINAQKQLERQCKAYYLAPMRQAQTNQQGAVCTFDSIHTPPEQRPSALNEILKLNVFDSLPVDQKNSLIAGLDEAVEVGIAEYKRRNGGNLPHASVLAHALSTAHNTVVQGKFDSITSLQQQQTAFVPDIPKITIANIIASASPVIAYVTNTNKSTKVPLIYLRTVANQTFGALKQGDYLDGAKSGQGYFEGRFKYRLVNEKGQKTYKQTATTRYLNSDEASMLPDPKAQFLPFFSENVSVRLQGLEIADTRNVPNVNSYGKPVRLNASQQNESVKIGDETYSFVSGQVNPTTGEVEVTLDKELPKDAVLTVHLITDTQATKDNNQNDYLLSLVGASLEDQIQYLQLVTSRCGFTIAPEVVEQYANELKISILSYPLNAIQVIFYLEQQIRLLKEGRDVAIGTDRLFRYDLQKGSTGNVAGAFNTTGDLVKEIFKQVDLAKVQMKQDSGASNSFLLYVGDVLSVMFKQMSSSDFTPTGQTAGHGEIVKLGTMPDGTEVYHTPTKQGVVLETNEVSDMLLVGRSVEPMQNPCVASALQAPIIEDVKAEVRKGQYAVRFSQNAELNPIGRFRQQFAVIEVYNVPNLLPATK